MVQFFGFAVARPGIMSADEAVVDDADKVLTDDEQIERLKQKLEEGSLGPYAFDKEFTKYHRRLTASFGSSQVARPVQRGRSQSSTSLTRQNTTNVDSD